MEGIGRVKENGVIFILYYKEIVLKELIVSSKLEYLVIKLIKNSFLSI